MAGGVAPADAGGGGVGVGVVAGEGGVVVVAGGLPPVAAGGEETAVGFGRPQRKSMYTVPLWKKRRRTSEEAQGQE